MSSLLLHLLAVLIDIVAVELRALRVLGVAVALVLAADIAARKMARR